MSTQTATPAAPAAKGERSSLLRLYLGRGVLAAAWALAFAGAHEDLDAPAITLLVVYPLFDAVSSLIDCRATPNGSERRVIAFNGALSTLAAVAIGITYNIQAAGDNPSLDVLSVYATGGGVWFILQALLLGWKSRRLRAGPSDGLAPAVPSRPAPPRRGPGLCRAADRQPTR